MLRFDRRTAGLPLSILTAATAMQRQLLPLPGTLLALHQHGAQPGGLGSAPRRYDLQDTACCVVLQVMLMLLPLSCRGLLLLAASPTPEATAIHVVLRGNWQAGIDQLHHERWLHTAEPQQCCGWRLLCSLPSIHDSLMAAAAAAWLNSPLVQQCCWRQQPGQPGSQHLLQLLHHVAPNSAYTSAIACRSRLPLDEAA